jgi:hypothetical protein
MAVGIVVALGASACSGDDDDDSAATTAGPQECVAYDGVVVAVDQAAQVDMLTSTPAEIQRALGALLASITDLSEVAGIDDAGIMGDIEGIVAEIPTDQDPAEDQLALNGLRDARDIVVADTRSWLDDMGIDCP